MSQILDYELLKFGTFSLKVHNLLGLIIIAILAFVSLRLLSRSIKLNKKNDEGAKYSLNQLGRYTIFVLAIILGILALGFNLSGRDIPNLNSPIIRKVWDQTSHSY